jgi:hypothetical protein
MTDPLLVMAQALEAASNPPNALYDSPNQYIRNDAFRTMAYALRQAAQDEGSRTQ